MKRLKSLVIAVFSLVAAGTFLSGIASVPARCQETAFDDLTRAEFQEYRGWKRVNRTPMIIRPVFFILDGADN